MQTLIFGIVGLIAFASLCVGGTLHFLGQTAGASPEPAEIKRFHFAVVCPGGVLYESLTQTPPTAGKDKWAVRLTGRTEEVPVPVQCITRLDDAVIWPGATGDLSVYLPANPPNPAKVAAKGKAGK